MTHHEGMAIVEAKEEHVTALRGRLRRGDYIECSAFNPADPDDMVRQSFINSDHCWAWIVGGRVGAMFGVQQDAKRPKVGLVWMVSTPDVEERPLYVARQSVLFVQMMLKAFDQLEALVDYRYAATLRWLGWLGFDLGWPEKKGVGGELFYTARIRRGEV
jgi:hypothetical protein